MAKTDVENIILDIAFSMSKDINNPNRVSDKQCEDILQGNVKEDEEDNGSILDKENALLKYSEAISGISKNDVIHYYGIWVLLLIIFGYLIIWFFLMKKTIDSNDDLIYIDNVFFNYCFLPICISLFFIIINWAILIYKIIRKGFSWIYAWITRTQKNKNDNAISSWNSFLYPVIQLAIPLSRLGHVLSWYWQKFLDFLRKKGWYPPKSEEQASLVISISKIKDIPYFKYLALLYWRGLVIVSLLLLAGLVYARFNFCGHDHNYGFTITDTYNLKYLRNWHASLLNFDTYLDRLNNQVLTIKDSDVIKEYDLKNPSKLELVEYKNKKAFDDIKGKTGEDLNNICFNYVMFCLFSPLVLHILYYLPYNLLCWFISRRYLAKKHEIRIDVSNDDVIGIYQKNVLDDLKIQYGNVCSKLILLQVSDDPNKSIFKSSDLKDWYEKRKKDYIFLDGLDGQDGVKSWIDTQNSLEHHPYIRTLVCLCDISQSISAECIKLISGLLKKNCYDIRIALIYDDRLCEEYPDRSDQIDKQLNRWQSELIKLEKDFHERYACCYRTDSQISDLDENIRLLTVRIKNSKDEPGKNLTVEESFKKIFEDLELQIHKSVWLQISDQPKESIVKYSYLKEWCEENKQDNIFLDGKEAVTGWIVKHNNLPVSSQTRTLVCLCDISQPVSDEYFKLLYSQLINKDKYGIRIALVYDKDLYENATDNIEQIDEQLKRWKNKLSILEKSFSEKSVWIPKKDSLDFEPDDLFEEIKNVDVSEANLTIEEAFNHIIEEIKPKLQPYPQPKSPESQPHSVLDQIQKLADKIVNVTKSPKPEPQPYCKTLLILDGITQENFRKRFDTFADKFKNIPMQWYDNVLVCNKNIANDIKADQESNCEVYYRIVLIAKIKSQFEGSKLQYLKNIINKVDNHERPLQVFIVASDMASVRQKEGNACVDRRLDYWGGVIRNLKMETSENVQFPFIEDFDYSIAESDSWTNFCAEVFPESDTEIVELPTPEERKIMFSKAIAAIQFECIKAFDNPQNKDACIKQTLQLSKDIHNIYFANDENNFFQGVLEQIGQPIKEIGGDVKEGCKQFGGKVVEGTKQLGKGIWNFLSNHMPTNGNLIGGSIGALAFIAPCVCATFATGVAISGVAYAMGAPALGVLGSITGGTIEDWWTKSRENRQKDRADKDSVFRKKSEDEQARILQVESLISNGLSLTLLYDGQGYSECTILETFNQVLQPLEVLYIYTKDDVEVLLNEVQSRWKNRCINN